MCLHGLRFSSLCRRHTCIGQDGEGTGEVETAVLYPVPAHGFCTAGCCDTVEKDEGTDSGMHVDARGGSDDWLW